MNETDIETEEKKIIKFNKRILLILICIPIIIIIFLYVYIMYWLYGTNNVDLKNISNNDKINIMKILNLNDEVVDVELDKLETPKTYKDISYKIYFSIDSEDKEKMKDANVKNDIEVVFNEIKETNNKTMYYCIIYSKTGKSIKILDEIISKYQK